MIVIIILLMMPPSYLMMWGGDSVPGDPSLPPVRQSDINAWRQLEQATVFQNFTSENITVDPDINPDEVIHDIISNQNILELMTKYMEGSGDRDHTNSVLATTRNSQGCTSLQTKWWTSDTFVFLSQSDQPNIHCNRFFSD